MLSRLGDFVCRHGLRGREAIERLGRLPAVPVATLMRNNTLAISGDDSPNNSPRGPSTFSGFDAEVRVPVSTPNCINGAWDGEPRPVITPVRSSSAAAPPTSALLMAPGLLGEPGRSPSQPRCAGKGECEFLATVAKLRTGTASPEAPQPRTMRPRVALPLNAAHGFPWRSGRTGQRCCAGAADRGVAARLQKLLESRVDACLERESEDEEEAYSEYNAEEDSMGSNDDLRPSKRRRAVPPLGGYGSVRA